MIYLITLFISRGHSIQIIDWPGFPSVPYKAWLFWVTQCFLISSSFPVFLLKHLNVTENVRDLGSAVPTPGGAVFGRSLPVTCFGLSSGRWGNIPFLATVQLLCRRNEMDVKLFYKLWNQGSSLPVLDFSNPNPRQYWFFFSLFNRKRLH